MKQLIGSSNLFVMQVEMDVYTALKKVLMYEYKKLLHRKKKRILLHIASVVKSWKYCFWVLNKQRNYTCCLAYTGLYLRKYIIN